MTDNFYNISAEETAKKLGGDTQKGLTEKEAQKRLRENGFNEIVQSGKKSVVSRFFEQFNDFMIITLLAAAAVSYITSVLEGSPDAAEPVIILAIVVFNALLGVIQESRAEKSLEELKKLSSPHACVIRDGEEKTIPARELVTGDTVVMAAGDIVCADCRIIDASGLVADESPLTGESEPVEKNAETIRAEHVSVGDRKNMLMSSSPVMCGRCRAIVVKTGMDTEVGQIASMLSDTEKQETPLKRKLADTGRILGIATLIICGVIFIAGLFKHIPAADMFMTSVSLAVAAIPEGLPAIVTIMLAIGLMRMSRHNAIVRNLPSVETLGSASVICSDKTGTLTQNKMHVTVIYGEDKKRILRLAALCSAEGLSASNPTDSAVLNRAEAEGISRRELDKKYKIAAENPFNSQQKRMAVLYRTNSGSITIVKGALEYILPMCGGYLKEAQVTDMTGILKNRILAENKRMTNDGLRVIAVAYREDDRGVNKITESGLVFAGLLGIEDPPRPEAAAAVRVCREAGIRPVMITGDHAGTALSIAKRTGIADEYSKVMTGAELDKISDASLAEHINEYSVFARVTPAHKVKIVKAFQKNGCVTAMTGDGVNDAPALSRADIGCSMGKSGTDVAKSASDMILTDYNFATIVSAVREGRNIFANIRKAVQFLLSSNIGEILAVFAGLMFGWASPLTATQLLWVNLVTDSLPAIALGLDPPEKDIMKKPPRDAKKSLFADGLWGAIVFEGLMIGSLALLAFSIGVNIFGSLIIGRTMAFAVLSLSELVHAFNMRSEKSVIKAGLFKNPYLTGSFLLGLALEAAVIMIPAAAGVFNVTALNVQQWTVTGILSVMPLVIVEIQKAFTALREGRKVK